MRQLLSRRRERLSCCSPRSRCRDSAPAFHTRDSSFLVALIQALALSFPTPAARCDCCKPCNNKCAPRPELLSLPSCREERECEERRTTFSWTQETALEKKNQNAAVMTIILFLVDTSASMSQRTYLGARPTLLDVAKDAIEKFLKVSFNWQLFCSALSITTGVIHSFIRLFFFALLAVTAATTGSGIARRPVHATDV